MAWRISYARNNEMEAALQEARSKGYEGRKEERIQDKVDVKSHGRSQVFLTKEDAEAFAESLGNVPGNILATIDEE